MLARGLSDSEEPQAAADGRMQGYLADNIRKSVEEPGLILALVLGDRSQLGQGPTNPLGADWVHPSPCDFWYSPWAAHVDGKSCSGQAPHRTSMPVCQ